ncbi:MAG: hypothetical protein ACKO34_01805 [Vampirovibrionales bacterium]
MTSTELECKITKITSEGIDILIPDTGKHSLAEHNVQIGSYLVLEGENGKKIIVEVVEYQSKEPKDNSDPYKTILTTKRIGTLSDDKGFSRGSLEISIPPKDIESVN